MDFDEDGEMICPVLCDGCNTIVPLERCGGPNMLCRRCRDEESDIADAMREPNWNRKQTTNKTGDT